MRRSFMKWIAIIFVFLVSFGAVANIYENKKSESLAIQKRQELVAKKAKIKTDTINYFKTNRSSIIDDMKQAIELKNYRSVNAIFNKYRIAADKELEALNKGAITEKIIADLKNIPAAEYQKNKDLYQKLAKLYPENEKYKEKYVFYTNKLTAEQAVAKARTERQEKIERQFSGWSGANRPLEKIIKTSMNDPDSYDHVKTVYWDKKDYLIVKTTFRGKNAFGGLVLNSVKAKISIGGNVLEIIEN